MIKEYIKNNISNKYSILSETMEDYNEKKLQ